MHAHGGCPYRVYVLVDLGPVFDSRMADLARRSADAHYRRVPLYVRSQYLVRKLDEFAEYLSRKVGRLALPSTGFFGVGDLLQLLEPPHAAEREGYFKMRLAGLLEDTGGHSLDEIDPELVRSDRDGVERSRPVIEMLMALRGPYHRRYITEFLDSVFKRRDAGMMHQSKGSARRFVLGSRLLGGSAANRRAGVLRVRILDAFAPNRRASDLPARTLRDLRGSSASRRWIRFAGHRRPRSAPGERGAF